MPFIMTALCMIFWIAIFFIFKRKLKQSLRDNIIVTFFVISYLLYPMISKMTFSLYNCVSYEDGYSYLKRDMSIQCWTGDHLKMSLIIGLFLILVWVVLFPLLIFVFMRRQRLKFEDQKTLLKYGFFYVGLNDDSYYWEIIVVNFRKIIFIILASILSNSMQVYKVCIIGLSFF